jgi:hypothetical protein
MFPERSEDGRGEEGEQSLYGLWKGMPKGFESVDEFLHDDVSPFQNFKFN